MKKRIAPLIKLVKGKRRHVCDYNETCINLAHKEVYPMMMGGKYKNKGWSYLCRRHFEQEKKKFKGKLPYSSLN